MEENRCEPVGLDKNMKSGLIVDMLTQLVAHYGFVRGGSVSKIK